MESNGRTAGFFGYWSNICSLSHLCCSSAFTQCRQGLYHSSIICGSEWRCVKAEEPGYLTARPSPHSDFVPSQRTWQLDAPRSPPICSAPTKGGGAGRGFPFSPVSRACVISNERGPCHQLGQPCLCAFVAQHRVPSREGTWHPCPVALLLPCSAQKEARAALWGLW